MFHFFQKDFCGCLQLFTSYWVMWYNWHFTWQLLFRTFYDILQTNSSGKLQRVCQIRVYYLVIEQIICFISRIITRYLMFDNDLHFQKLLSILFYYALFKWWIPLKPVLGGVDGSLDLPLPSMNRLNQNEPATFVFLLFWDCLVSLGVYFCVFYNIIL